jgi:hypothetical protein
MNPATEKCAGFDIIASIFVDTSLGASFIPRPGSSLLGTSLKKTRVIDSCALNYENPSAKWDKAKDFVGSPAH